MNFPSFTDYFEAIYGFSPYPWQSELAERACTGDWPDAVNIPTGFGKTATIAIAVYAAAYQTHRGGKRTAPQRIVHVVNRRSVVDQTYETIGPAMDGPPAAFTEVCDELAGPFATDTGSVTVAAIHADSPDSREWLRPTGIVVLTTTPHQLVSRLLARGIGVSPRTCSVHAGLLGVDSLILFDEPHLSPQAAHTVRRVLQMQAEAPGDIGVPASRLVLLGATLDEPSGDEIRLSETDERVAFERHVAPRPVELVEATVSDGAVRKAMLSKWRSERESDPQRRIVIIANTVRLAQELYAEIAESEPGAVLVTSRMRPADREQIISLLGDGDSGRPRTVVATQTFEVGVDFSFDSLITEACPYPALVQRVGRLNRKGERPDARGFLVLAKDRDRVRSGSAAVYGVGAIAETNRFLADVAVDSIVDMSIAAQRSRGPAPTTAPEPSRLATFDASYLGVMTTTYPTPWSDLRLASFIDGPDAPESLDVLVAWRDRPKLVETCPPNAGEFVAVPLPALRAMLQNSGDVEVSDGERLPEEPGTRVLDSSRVERGAGGFIRRDDRWKRLESTREIRPGDIVVLDRAVGGYLPRLGWRPASESPVPDYSIVAALPRDRDRRGTDRRQHSPFHVSPATVEAWIEYHGVPEVGDQELTRLFDDRDEIGEDEFVRGLSDLVPSLELLQELEWASADSGDLIAWMPPRTRASDEPKVVELDAHQQQVKDVAASVCARAGIDAEVVPAILRAAIAHDEGKRDGGFQRYLGNDASSTGSTAWAKSNRGATTRAVERRFADLAGHSIGWRHEGLSASLLAEKGHSDLAVHLVGSHHGRFRPLLAARSAGDGQQEMANRVESFERLNEQWGAWGLAYLEAVVRLSDWHASSRPEESIEKVSGSPEPPSQRRVIARARPTDEIELRGVTATPLTGWFAIAGLLRCAFEAGDCVAEIRWNDRGDLPPTVPVWRSQMPLLEVCKALLESDQWARLAAVGAPLIDGLARKNQKVGPADSLRGALLPFRTDWLVAGIANDAAPANSAGELGSVAPLAIAAQANNASYVSTALNARDGLNADDLRTALTDPSAGWGLDQCDGGMDRAGIDDGVSGREVKAGRVIRRALAPPALMGMASMGSVGVDGLGVRNRTLRLPLPTEFTDWLSLTALTHAVGTDHGWVLEYEHRPYGKSVNLWDGHARRD